MGKKKSTAIKFHVLRRSESGPLIDDSSAEFVMVPTATVQKRERRLKGRGEAVREDPGGPLIQLPDGVLHPDEQSGHQKQEQILRQEDMPEEVRDALQGEEGEFDELEDDFMTKLMMNDDEDDGEDDEKSNGEEFLDLSTIDEGLLRIESSEEEEEDVWQETVAREGALGDVDAAFSTFISQYADEEIGDLEDDPDAVGVHDTVAPEVLDTFIEDSQRIYVPGEHQSAEAAEVIAITRRLARRLHEEEVDDEVDEVFNAGMDPYLRRDNREQWDCESIISTYSNVENHPRLVTVASRKQRQPIRLCKRTALPIDDDLERIEEQESSGDDDDAEEQRGNLGQARPKRETAEQKRDRKRAVKEMRQRRRQGKKAMKLAFASEEGIQANALRIQRLRNPVVMRL